MNADSDYAYEYYAVKRRKTLFNLYGFTLTDSYQKDVPMGPSGNVTVSKNFQIPTLILSNVEFRNFLYNYQSLINIENDNFITANNDVDQTDIAVT